MQVNRLFQIIYILLENKVVTSKELAEKFEVSQRTIYRDIETLSGAGIPIYMSKGKGGGISILPDFILNKAVLTEEEKLEILSSLTAFNAVTSLESNNKNIINKLKNILGDNNKNWIEVDFSNWGNAEKEKEIFNKVKYAVLNKNVLEFFYMNGKGENIHRRVYPIKLYFKGQSWYLYGYCTLREDFRFFKLRRLKNLDILSETFNIEEPKNIFSKESYYKEDFIALTLKISSKMAYRVYDEFEEFQEVDEGFIIKTNYPKGEWLMNYIASFGAECIVLEPQCLIEEIKNRFTKILENYS